MNQYVITNFPKELADLSSKKLQKVMENIPNKKQQPEIKPLALIDNPGQCNLDGESQPSFQHARGPRPTHLASLTSEASNEQSSLSFPEDQRILEAITKFKDFAFISEHAKKFEHLRKKSKSFDNFEDTQLSSKFIEFLKEAFKTKDLYNKYAILASANISFNKNIDLSTFDENELLLKDLCNDRAFNIVLCLFEIFDKITDDEIYNCMVLNSHNFIHPINFLLSPAALSLSFYHYYLLGLKKTGRDENYFSKHSLPRVTYIDLTGFYSDINVRMLNSFSENVQTIAIYDGSTGGSPILEGCYNHEENFNKNIQEISNKLLLVPLRYSEGKSYGPNDILSIFEEIVVRAVEKYKPLYIVLNCSFTHDEDSKTPFWIDGPTWGQIVRWCTQLTEGKVIVCPFKLPDLEKNAKVYKTIKDSYFLKGKAEKKSEEQKEETLEKEKEKIWEQPAKIIEKYGCSYDEIYVSQCVMSTVEALAGFKDTNRWARADFRRKFGLGPLTTQVLYLMGRYYKDHPFYHFLYTKASGPLARLTGTNFGEGNKALKDLKNKRTEIIPIFYLDSNNLKIAQLQLSSSRDIKIVLNSSSQYFVAYDNQDEPYLYVFNGRIDQVIDNITVPGNEATHFRLSLEIDTTTQLIVALSSNDIPKFEVKSNDIVVDAGLCRHERYVFQVYGTLVSKNNDSNKIICYNFEEEEKFEVNVSRPAEILARHAVTTCAFEKDGKFYLYSFGGRVQPGIRFRNRTLGYLDIIDIVEVYETSWPPKKNSIWNYTFLPKELLYGLGNITYVPYYGSFAYYNKDTNRIKIMGGKIFQESTYDWTFPIFEFDVDEKKFTQFEIVLNKNKKRLFGPRTSYKKNKDTYKRPALPVAIADLNKNFIFNSKTNGFEFIVPCFDENRMMYYSYDANSKTCDFDEVELDRDESKDKIAPPSLGSSQDASKSVPLTTRLSTKIKYLFTSKESQSVLRELINWRLGISDNTIEEKALIEKIQSMKEIANRKVLNNIIKVIEKNKDLQDVLKNKDNRLEIIRSHLSKFDESHTIEDQSTYSLMSFISGKDAKTVLQNFLRNRKKIYANLAIDMKKVAEVLNNYIQSLLLFCNMPHSFEVKFSKIEESLKELIREVQGQKVIKPKDENLNDKSINLNSTKASINDTNQSFVQDSSTMNWDSSRSSREFIEFLEFLSNEGYRLNLGSVCSDSQKKENTKEYFLKPLQKLLADVEIINSGVNYNFKLSFDDFCQISRGLGNLPIKTIKFSQVFSYYIELLLVYCGMKNEKSSSFPSDNVSNQDISNFDELEKRIIDLVRDIEKQEKEKINKSAILQDLSDISTINQGKPSDNLSSQSIFMTLTNNDSSGNIKSLSDPSSGFCDFPTNSSIFYLMASNCKDFLICLLEEGKKINLGGGKCPDQNQIENVKKEMLEPLQKLLKEIEIYIKENSVRSEEPILPKELEEDKSEQLEQAKRDPYEEKYVKKSTSEGYGAEWKGDRTENKLDYKAEAKMLSESKEDKAKIVALIGEVSELKDKNEQLKEELRKTQEEKENEVKMERDKKELLERVLQEAKENERKIKEELEKAMQKMVESKTDVVEEEKIDHVKIFRRSLETQNDYRIFFNGSRSELIVAKGEVSKEKEQKLVHLKFRVALGKSRKLEDISFEFSPFSVCVYQSSVVCYIDSHFKDRYRNIYKEYKSWVMYADIPSAMGKVPDGEDFGDLVFNKLFLITQDEEIFHRCLMVNEESLFLFGGKSYKYKRSKAESHKNISRYELKKFQDMGQTSSHFKDPEAEPLEDISGECVGLYDDKNIFVCKRADPNKLLIYSKVGIIEEDVEMDSKTFKNCTVTMNLIAHGGTNKILFTLYKEDKPLEFKLYNIKEKSFDDGNIKMVPNESDIQLFYSGFEQIEVNTGVSPLSEEILFCIQREDPVKLVGYKLES